MIFEAAPKQADAIGQQGRGQRVAGMALVPDSVEGEAKGSGPVDPTAGGMARAGHALPSSPDAAKASTATT